MRFTFFIWVVLIFFFLFFYLSIIKVFWSVCLREIPTTFKSNYYNPNDILINFNFSERKEKQNEGENIITWGDRAKFATALLIMNKQLRKSFLSPPSTSGSHFKKEKNNQEKHRNVWLSFLKIRKSHRGRGGGGKEEGRLCSDDLSRTNYCILKSDNGLDLLKTRVCTAPLFHPWLHQDNYIDHFELWTTGSGSDFPLNDATGKLVGDHETSKTSKKQKKNFFLRNILFHNNLYLYSSDKQAIYILIL